MKTPQYDFHTPYENHTVERKLHPLQKSHRCTILTPPTEIIHIEKAKTHLVVAVPSSTMVEDGGAESQRQHKSRIWTEQ